MRIAPLSNISFQKLKMKEHPKTLRTPEPYYFNAQDDFRTKHTMYADETGSFTYALDLRSDDFSEQVAYETAEHYIPTNSIYVRHMDTKPKHRNHGFGAVMHLTNVIEMLENNADNVALFSLPQSIPFHYKLGFKIDEDDPETLQKTLRPISMRNEPELTKHAFDAEKLLSEELSKEEFITKANSVINDYLKTATCIIPKKDQDRLIFRPMPMLLKKEDVIKNSEFYNELFKKYNIDYRVEDAQ